MAEENKNIYNMKLHEQIPISPEIGVIRVPGGWLYRFWDFDGENYHPNITFVPFDNEFMERGVF